MVGVINCFREMTDRKLADERRSLLISELNHHLKKTLITIQSIAAHSFGKWADGEASKWFEKRLLPLARAHDALTSEN